MSKRAALFLTSFLAPSIALAAAPNTYTELANQLVTIMNAGTGVIIVLGVAFYFWGISTNILKFGDKDKEKFRAYFFWGIIVLFVMVSVWGIVGLLQSTLFGGTGYGGTGSVSPTGGFCDQFGNC